MGAHEAFWTAARAALGDTDGTRELVEVLLLHRHLPAEHVVAGLNAATTVGAVRADVVAVEARRIAQDSGAVTLPAAQAGVVAGMAEPSVADLSERVVARLTERRLGDPAAVIAGLPPDNRPLPSVEHYDELLTLTRKRAAAAAAAAAAQAAPISKGQVS